jgi:hypothetical protein
MKRFLLFLTVFVIFLVGAANIPAAAVMAENPIADVMIGSSGINWLPKVSYEQLLLTVSRPDGTVFQKTFSSSGTPYLDLSNIFGTGTCDGIYTYELRVIAPNQAKTRKNEEKAGLEQSSPVSESLAQTGHFMVKDGAVISSSAQELSRVMDVVHADDVIITGSLCVGFDCLTDGTENFGFDTIKMKENNIRLFFDDTSTTAGFPANDWRIIANDSASGGGNYLSIEDSTNAKTPFKIEANAKTSAIYVSSTGRVGFGTATPILNLHIVHGDTPSIRLDQDTSSGWTAQVWDIAGNESNFFVRDTTGGSKLPFRIQPGTPTNTLTLKSDGKVGIGTWSPTYALEIDTTGTAANFICKRTDGASGCIVADATHVFIGAKTNHDFRLLANDSPKITVLPSGFVGIGTTGPTHLLHLSGGAYSDGATWQPASSRQYKENITNLTLDEAKVAMEGLNPVKFNYKTNKEEDYIGFIAEDVPGLVATKDRKSLNPMDVVAVLTKVLQDQQKMIREHQKTIETLQKKIAELEKK